MAGTVLVVDAYQTWYLLSEEVNERLRGAPGHALQRLERLCDPHNKREHRIAGEGDVGERILRWGIRSAREVLSGANPKDPFSSACQALERGAVHNDGPFYDVLARWREVMGPRDRGVDAVEEWICGVENLMGRTIAGWTGSLVGGGSGPYAGCEEDFAAVY